MRVVGDLSLGLAVGQHPILNLAPPPLALRLGHPSQTVAVHAQSPLDDVGTKTLANLKADERQSGQLILAHPIVGTRLQSAHHLADRHEQLERDAGPFAHLRECILAQRHERVIAGRLDEREREVSTLDDARDAFEGNASMIEGLQQHDAADGTDGQLVVGVDLHQSQRDQAVQIVGAYSGALSGLSSGEEFALLVRVDSPDNALVVAERFRMNVAALALAHVDNSPHDVVTPSIGATPFGAYELAADDDTLFGRADEAPYRAKVAGRNRSEGTVEVAAVQQPGQAPRERRGVPATALGVVQQSA